jgi:hypothetical protein
MKKCLYCGKEVSEDAVMDFCDNCGTKIWGPKMLATIKKNYGEAKDNDDLTHMDTSATLKALRGNPVAGKNDSVRGSKDFARERKAA